MPITRNHLRPGAIIAAAMCVLFIFASSASAKTAPQADYRFDGTLKSSVKGAPALRDIGKGNKYAKEKVPGEGKTEVRTFKKGSGFLLKTKKLIPSNDYSVIVDFRFVSAGPSGPGYLRLLNPTLAADDNDNGLYVYEDYLTWYDGGSNDGTVGTINKNKYAEVAFTRSKTGQIRVYANGKTDIKYDDLDFQAVIQDYKLRFFVDNSNGEESAGAVSRIRAYKGALSSKQVKKVYEKGH